MRGKSVEEADADLSFLTRLAAKPLRKLLKSAIANAKHNFNVEKSNLFVKKITVDKGPTIKRFMPRARGMASPIKKMSSHVTLILDVRN